MQFGFGTPPVLLASMSSDVLRSDFTYNALGQQLSQNDYADDGTTVIVNQTATFNAAGQVTDQYTSTLKADGKTYTSDVSNVYGTSGTAAYALGAVLSSTAANGVIDGGTTTTTHASTTNTFVWREGALQNTIAYDSDTGSFDRLRMLGQTRPAIAPSSQILGRSRDLPNRVPVLLS